MSDFAEKKVYGVGLIGFGTMGKAHTYAYQTLPFYYSNLPFRIRLTGVCSGHRANAERAAADYGYARAYDNYRELLADPDIDIVNICTPNHLHKEMIVAAIQAGKHVYCDKPLVTSPAEADEVLAALAQARENGLSLINQAAYQNRFFPATLRARQIMDAGQLGRILAFRAAYLHSGSVDPQKPIGWKQDQAFGGGVLVDIGSHALDLMYCLLGEYAEVDCRTVIAYPRRPDKSGQLVDIQADDAAIMIVKMKSGCMGTIEASKIATGTQDELRFEIHGTQGALRFNLMDPNWLEFYDQTVPERPLGGQRGFTRIECVQRYEQPGGTFPAAKSSIGWLRGHAHSIYCFLDCVYQGRPASPSFQDAAYIQQVLAAASESARSGRTVQLT